MIKQGHALMVLQLIATIKKERIKKKLKLKDVCLRSGLMVTTLSRLETGKQLNPTWKTLCRYAEAIDMRINIKVNYEPFEQITFKRKHDTRTETTSE